MGCKILSDIIGSWVVVMLFLCIIFLFKLIDCMKKKNFGGMNSN